MNYIQQLELAFEGRIDKAKEFQLKFDEYAKLTSKQQKLTLA